ncbi:DNA polymerase beta superfamily protein [Halocola ammonii]
MAKKIKMTIDDLKKKDLIVLQCISGSRAYGLDTPQSDTDIKGVFILPEKEFYGLNSIRQVSNSTNDITYYELGRFFELLAVNNPNILELLNTPKDSILLKHPLLTSLNPKTFLSKLCKDTFGKFALSQIKKARGLNKKIVNPVDKERKSILEFCYVDYLNGSLPLSSFLEMKNWDQSDCGLVNIPNMKNIFGLYHDPKENYKGIISSEKSNEVSLSSISKSANQECLLYFNKDGYSSYCKKYREYWQWVKERNDARFETTKSHGKNYDSKNMMHVFRLLEMATEIAITGEINVRRPNRDFLLSIKSGSFEYEELLDMAEERKLEMERAFELSSLPEEPDQIQINELLFHLRKNFYKS